MFITYNFRNINFFEIHSKGIMKVNAHSRMVFSKDFNKDVVVGSPDSKGPAPGFQSISRNL